MAKSFKGHKLFWQMIKHVKFCVTKQKGTNILVNIPTQYQGLKYRLLTNNVAVFDFTQNKRCTFEMESSEYLYEEKLFEEKIKADETWQSHLRGMN